MERQRFAEKKQLATAWNIEELLFRLSKGRGLSPKILSVGINGNVSKPYRPEKLRCQERTSQDYYAGLPILSKVSLLYNNSVNSS